MNEKYDQKDFLKNESEYQETMEIKNKEIAPNQFLFKENILSDSEAIFSYKFDNISKLSKSEESPPCYLRGLPWRILIMTDNLGRERVLSIFLQCNSECETMTWSCQAQAEIRLKPVHPDQKSFKRNIKYLFNSKTNDWGFKNFISFEELCHAETGYAYQDSVTIEVHVSAEAPHGVFWDSKKNTGYVGLMNQGATCYMNSLLQTIFFTNEFRKAVYCMPTEADDGEKSVALALQRVFYELQFSSKPIGTKQLTKSFGWETLDSFMQHDVQEFLRVLLDKIETKMKGTCLEGIVPRLFEGKMLSYIRCKNVDYNSSRVETFYDIQLNIKNKKNIYESFEDYISPEILENDNKYEAGQYGLQDAEKGVIFNSLPPVLHLHLMRFHYDPFADNCIKFNDRFEFYESINLDKYLAQKDTTPADYTLHAVLVHSGDNHGGHYVVYINADAKGKWFRFDDDVVSLSTNIEAIEHNYGGIDDEMKYNTKSCSSAYMLSYIRNSEISTVLKEISEDDIPDELIKRLAEDKHMEEIKKIEKNNFNIVTIHVVLEEYFESHEYQNLFDPDKIPYKIFRISSTLKFQELIDIFASSFKVSKDRLKIWSLMFQNEIIRCVYFDYVNMMAKNLQSLKDIRQPWVIFLQIATPLLREGSLPVFDPKQNILLFCKYYDSVGKHLNYLCSSYQLWNSKLSNIIDEVNELLYFNQKTQLIVYEEQSGIILHPVTDTLEKCLKHKKTDFQQGIILVFEKKENDEKQILPSFHDYLNNLLYRIEVNFVDKLDTNESCSFSLNLSERCSVNEMIFEVAQKINTEPNKIQLFKCSGNKTSYNTPLEIGCRTELRDLFSGRTRSSKKIYYQKLTMDVNELENKMQFRVTYLSANLKEEIELILYPCKKGKISNLLDEAKKHIRFSDDSTKMLRFTQIYNHRLLTIFDENTDLEVINVSALCNQPNQKSYRIEEIAKNELWLSDNEMLIPVSHFSKEICSLYGTPFFIPAVQSQTFSSLKDTIRKKINISEKEWSTYKIACVSMGHVNYITDDCADCVDLQYFKLPNTRHYISYIGIDHINKMQKKLKDSGIEKSIKIYN